MAAFDRWDSFYVTLGSAAGALIGLQFVVMTLIAERPPSRAVEADAAFGTPTIVHFSATLLLSVTLLAPWPDIAIATMFPEFIGVAGALYVLLVARRIHVQRAYEPEFEDWLFHAALPFAAYGVLAAAAFLAARYPREVPFGIGGGALLLLFIAIHNAWDSVAYLVFVSGQKAGDRRESGESPDDA